jgi:hypothetical protein
VSRRTLCPVCWNKETLRARLNEREPCRDDPPQMTWHRPYGGPRGQIVTRWDGGWWACEQCEFRATAHDVGVLLDAALMASDPDCDSIRDGMHEDARLAFLGGSAERAAPAAAGREDGGR